MLATPLDLSTLVVNSSTSPRPPAFPMTQRFSLPSFEGSLFSQNLRDLFHGGCHS
jgi:hypothetical protein